MILVVFCRDALKIIERYDCPGAFHFVDPPYVGSDCGHYAGSFNEQNLRQLLELLSVVQDKFMLTMYPNDEIAGFAEHSGWIIHKVERNLSASKENRRKQEEWMVCNYEIEKRQTTLF